MTDGKDGKDGEVGKVAMPRFLLSVISVLSVFSVISCSLPNTPRTRITIPHGSSFQAVTDTLRAHDLIASPAWFRTLARVRGLDRNVRAGIYDVPQGAPAWAVLDLLANGAQAMVRVSVPEGVTVADIAAIAESALMVPAESVMVAAQDDALRDELGVPGTSLEGFLFPETYMVTAGSSARDLLRQMVKEGQRQWDPSWDSLLAAQGLSRLQAVTLASIVEGEARVDDEREIIAGVYLNRVKRGMPLQADPTVQYAIQLATGRRKPRLYEKDYQFRSPYNTYLNPGLPPGPVNSPSRRSLEAVVHPREVPWLFFVAGEGGRHVFSRTYREHLRAIAMVRSGAPKP